MPKQREFLRHDLTALYAFIDYIGGDEGHREPSVAYGPAATRFLHFVTELATSCKDYIETWDVEDDEEYEDRREELGTIWAAWKELHALIKPALDADTLKVPSAVVDGIVRRFKQLPKNEDAEFALFHSSEFNYVEVRTADLGNIATKLRTIVPNAPPFPDQLGLIGIPYSQGKAAFSNCLIAHEIGHYVYRQHAVEILLRSKIDHSLSKAIDNYANEDEAKKGGMVAAVIRWAEELFCDFFGIQLVGPAYSCAYMEAYDLYAVLDDDGKPSNERLSPRLNFYEKHPSHIYRLKQQAIFLHESSWRNHLDVFSSRFAGMLHTLIDLELDAHCQYRKLEELVPALDSVIPEIKQAIGSAFADVDDGFTEFQRLNPTVQQYLANGIVPSTLVVRTGRNPDDVEIVPASPFALLNSGMQFYLTQIDSFMQSIKGESVSDFSRRLHWIRRIEQWISKAIEDQSLGVEAINEHPNDHRNPATPQA
jgi:hypothetical protein